MTEVGASSGAGPSAPAESLRQLVRFFRAEASTRAVELLLNPAAALVGTVNATVETARALTRIEKNCLARAGVR